MYFFSLLPTLQLLHQPYFVLLYPTFSYLSRIDATNGYTIPKRSCAMRPLKTKVSITLDTETIEVIKDLAEQDDRSFSQYINLVLKEYLKTLQEKQEKTN